MCFEGYNENDNLTFVANVTVDERTWDGKKTGKTLLTKGSTYEGVVINDHGQSAIQFKNDQEKQHILTYNESVGTIGIIENVQA